jgi:hypothetical protein
MQAIETVSLHCPYCGEAISLLVEGANEPQEYIEDCEVCCRPISIKISELGDVQALHENEV